MMAEVAEELQACRNAIERIKDIKNDLQEIRSIMEFQDEVIFKYLMKKNFNVEPEDKNGVENKEKMVAENVAPPPDPVAPGQTRPPTVVKPNRKEIPQIEFLSVEEFSSVPKYMKGRISIDAVNKLISELNTTITEKYKLMRTHRSKLSENNMQLVKMFKGQECEETHGAYFCTDADLKHFTNVKPDKQLCNYCNILRHCGRIRDIRSAGGLVRHVVIQRYT